MPVIGIPKTLEVLLSTLFDKDELKSWQIFEERSGTVMVKLRFTGSHGGGHAQSTMTGTGNMEPSSYKRKSDKQVKRDRQRAVNHQDNIHSKEGVITRSKSAKSDCIEQPRHEDMCISLRDLNPLSCSPEIVEPDSPTCSHASVTTDSNTTPVLTADQLTESFTSVNSIPENTRNYAEDENVEENDTCLSSDSDDERAIDKPPERQCSYCGMFEHWNLDIYECVKPNCGRKMCYKCKRKLHKRHRGNHQLLENVKFASLRLNNMSYKSNM